MTQPAANMLLDDLKEQIARGQVVAIIGAGVSIGATNRAECAAWTGLLYHGVHWCEHLKLITPEMAHVLCQQIDSGDLDFLLAAAETIAAKLGAPKGGEYRRWLRESVGALKAEWREALEALRDLHVALATTNYDGLIGEVTGLPPVTWMDGAVVESVLRGDEPGVLHLHGYWRDPESVILGIRSYEQVLGNEPAQNIQRTLATVKTLLFVGCGEGLHDPNFGKLIEWTGRVFAQSEYRRYRLALESEREKLQKQHPPEQRLFVISYGQQHPDLAPFLRSLGAYRPNATPTPHAAAATPGVATLPARPRCFGRAADIEALVKNLLAPRPEPTPILGAPGIGKSTLTLAALHDEHVAAHYGARRYFIRCDGVKSRLELVAALALAFGLTPSPNIEPAVLVELAKAPTALAIDNAETPWEADTLAVEEFLALLAGIPGLALIASVRGAQRPMGVSWHESLEPTRLKLPAAREAFLAIAGKKFQTDPRLDAMIQAMDGVPLAITLLAYQAEGEPSLEPLWQRWQHERTAMLQRAEGQDRLTNIELSYEISLTGKRMTEAAHRLLRLLALLPDGLAHRDLSVAIPDQAEAAASVLRKAGLGFDEAERLRLLKPLRDYISDKHLRDTHLLQSDDQARLVKHFVQLAADLGAQVGSATGAQAVQHLTPEAANIEAMFSLALEGSYAAEVTQAAIAWGGFVHSTGLGSTRPLEQAASRAREHGDTQEVANCIWKLGDIAFRRSDNGQARERYEQALPLYRQAGDLRGEAHCIRGLGHIALIHSDHGQARERYEQALPLYRQVGDLLGEANCIRNLGDTAFRRSDHGQAREHYEQALPLYRQVGDLLGEAGCIQGLGDIALARSDHGQARERYEQALPLYRQVGNLLGEAHCIQGLGGIALARSDHGQAREHYEQALPLYRQVGDLLGEAHCIQGLGGIALARSDHGQARERYEQALPLYRQVGDLRGEANCIRNLGDTAFRRSDHGQAREHYEQALPLYRQVGDLLGEAGCIQGLGDIALARSDHGQARERYEQALPLYRQAGDLLGEANCIQGLGGIALARSDHGQARERYEQALPLYRQVGDVVGEAICLWGLGNIAFVQSDYAISKARYEESLVLLRQAGHKHNEGECLLSLGDLALAVSEPLEARSYFDTALNLFKQIDQVEWIGHASRRLARIAVDEQERRLLVEAACEAWESIDRPDLVEDLTQEFGRDPC